MYIIIGVIAGFIVGFILGCIYRKRTYNALAGLYLDARKKIDEFEAKADAFVGKDK